MIPLPDDTPSLFILVRAVKQPLLAPLFVTLATTFDRVEIICRGNAKREEILRILIRIGQRAVNIGR